MQVLAARVALVNDHTTGETLCRDWGLPSSRMRFVPFPVDTTFFRPADLHGHDATPYVLIPGNSDRVEDVVVALADTLDINIIRVTADARVKRYYANLRKPMPRLQLKAQVTFAEIRTLYQHALATVLPVRNHRHPAGLHALLESFACGTPVLATKGNTTRDYLEHGRHGLHLEGDVSANLYQIKSALADKPRLTDMGHAARAAAETHSIEALAAAWQAAFL